MNISNTVTVITEKQCDKHKTRATKIIQTKRTRHHEFLKPQPGPGPSMGLDSSTSLGPGPGPYNYKSLSMKLKIQVLKIINEIIKIHCFIIYCIEIQ